MTDQPPVRPERVVELLQRSDLGQALWRAATWEAIAEAQQVQIEALQQGRTAAVPEPGGA